MYAVSDGIHNIIILGLFCSIMFRISRVMILMRGYMLAVWMRDESLWTVILRHFFRILVCVGIVSMKLDILSPTQDIGIS